MSLLVLGTMLLGQTSTIPASASIVLTGIPELTTQNATMPTHAVTVKLDKTSLVLDSLSSIRNGSDKPVNVQVRLPIRGYHPYANQLNGYSLTALVNKAPATLTPLPEYKTSSEGRDKQSGIVANYYEKGYVLNLSFKAKETKSISVHYKALQGRAGLDALQRMVAYDTRGASTWNGGIGQFNYAIQYPQNLILQVFATLPDGKFQVGKTGAFFKQYDFKDPVKELVFTYYQNSFEKIGGNVY